MKRLTIALALVALGCADECPNGRRWTPSEPTIEDRRACAHAYAAPSGMADGRFRQCLEQLGYRVVCQ